MYFHLFLCVYEGPETWWVYCPSASGGNQSPIDILTEDVIIEHDYSSSVNPLRLNYSASFRQLPAAESATGVGGVGGAGSAGPGSADGLLLVNTGTSARIDVINSHFCTFLSYFASKRLKLTIQSLKFT